MTELVPHKAPVSKKTFKPMKGSNRMDGGSSDSDSSSESSDEPPSPLKTDMTEMNMIQIPSKADELSQLPL